MWESRFGASSVELGLADSAIVQESSCSLRPPDGHSHHHSNCPSNTEAKCQLRTAGNYANVRTPKPPPRLPALRRRHASSHKCLSLQLLINTLHVITNIQKIRIIPNALHTKTNICDNSEGTWRSGTGTGSELEPCVSLLGRQFTGPFAVLLLAQDKHTEHKGLTVH